MISSKLWLCQYYCMDASHGRYKTHGEKARGELQKNATSYFEQILEATPHETKAVRPLTSHLKNRSSKMKKICRTLLEKQRRTHK